MKAHEKPVNRHFIDLEGQEFGRLLVSAYMGSKRTHKYWLCLCSCGNKIISNSSNLRTGNTTSCGCFHKQMSAAAKLIHGFTGSSEYSTFQSMKQRCYDSKSISYPSHGARGIKICDRWRFGEGDKVGFQCFLEDMGPKPFPTYSIDRINNDGNYSKENCRWATATQQSLNRRSNRFVVVQGIKMTLSEACRQYGVHRQTVANRIKRGASVDSAFLGG